MGSTRIRKIGLKHFTPTKKVNDWETIADRWFNQKFTDARFYNKPSMVGQLFDQIEGWSIALKYLDKAIVNIDQFDDCGKMDIYLQHAHYVNKNNVPDDIILRGIDYAKKALEYAKKCPGLPPLGVEKIDVVISLLHAELGSREIEKGQLERAHGEIRKAITSLEIAVAAARRYNILEAYVGYSQNLGIMHRRLGDPRQAVKIYKEVLATIDQNATTARILYIKCLVLYALGVALLETKDPKLGFEALEKSLKLAIDHGMQDRITFSFRDILRCYLELGDRENASQFFRKYCDRIYDSGLNRKLRPEDFVAMWEHNIRLKIK